MGISCTTGKVKKMLAQHQPQKVSQKVPSKRKHRRVAVDGFLGDIADGKQVLVGVVSNVSSNGIKMSKVPYSFSAEKKHYVAVISGNNKHFRVCIQPRWFQKDEQTNSMDVGFKIIDSSWEWSEFIYHNVLETD